MGVGFALVTYNGSTWVAKSGSDLTNFVSAGGVHLSVASLDDLQAALSTAASSLNSTEDIDGHPITDKTAISDVPDETGNPDVSVYSEDYNNGDKNATTASAGLYISSNKVEAATDSAITSSLSA